MVSSNEVEQAKIRVLFEEAKKSENAAIAVCNRCIRQKEFDVAEEIRDNFVPEYDLEKKIQELVGNLN